jgi:7,8-dihydroneopterin aldolase/epimerase/oxygenase
MWHPGRPWQSHPAFAFDFARPCAMLGPMMRDPEFGGERYDSTYRIFVRDLVVAVSIGIHAHEKRQRARVRVNAELLIATEPPRYDDFATAFNYETVVGGIKSVAGAGHINLVETFAERVAALCFADPRVSAVRVTVEKLDIYPEAESVGVTIERRRTRA